MLDDVLRAVKGRIPVEFYGRMGGVMPFPDEIFSEIQRLVNQPLVVDSDPRKAWMRRLSNIINSNN
jgi:2-oxoglutarate ferredoxin oxidoreductase subunit alpha